MRTNVVLLFFQLSLISIISFRRVSVSRYSRYDTILSARRSSSPDSGLLSYQSNDKEEIDNRPNFIHRAQVADNHPQKLLEFVYTVFPDVKRTQAKQWLQHTSLLVNDEPQTQFDLALRIGDWVSVRAGKSKGGSRSSSGDSKRKTYGVLPFGLKIVFEDEAMFIVDKPHGLPVSSAQQAAAFSASNRDAKISPNNSTSSDRGTDKKFVSKKDGPVSNTKTVHSIVSSFIGKRAGNSDTKTFVVNRMDEEESGLVVLAKSAAAKEYLYKNWNSFGVVYNVLVEGLLFPQQGTIKTFMDESAAAVTCSPLKLNTSKSSVPAVSHYRTLESVSSPSSLLFGGKSIMGGLRSGGQSQSSAASFSLLEVSLETTSRDQLRAHFSYMNRSICGDYRYGPLMADKLDGIEGGGPALIGGNPVTVTDGIDIVSSNSDSVSIHDPIRRLGVHFSELRMTHPLTKDALTVISQCPASFSDLIRRSQSQTSSTLFESPTTISTIAEDYEGDEGDGDEDGQSDSLRRGSEKHIADSNSNDKIKVFTLTEFLGPAGKIKTKSSGAKNSPAGPPDNSNKFFVKKAKK